MYLDPGSGSVILQALIAVFLGAGVLTKIYWKKITGLFRKDKNTETVAVTETSEENDK